MEGGCGAFAITSAFGHQVWQAAVWDAAQIWLSQCPLPLLYVALPRAFDRALDSIIVRHYWWSCRGNYQVPAVHSMYANSIVSAAGCRFGMLVYIQRGLSCVWDVNTAPAAEVHQLLEVAGRRRTNRSGGVRKYHT